MRTWEIDRGDFKDSDFEDEQQPEIACKSKPDRPYISQCMTDIITIRTTNLRPKVFDHGEFNNEQQPKIAAKTGNTYISKTMKDNI